MMLGIMKSHSYIALGQRDPNVCEPESAEEFLELARSLGFSAEEIAALATYYWRDDEEVKR